jgi:hypothetical protein
MAYEKARVQAHQQTGGSIEKIRDGGISLSKRGIQYEKSAFDRNRRRHHREYSQQQGKRVLSTSSNL